MRWWCMGYIMHNSCADNHIIGHYYADHVSIIKSCHNLAPSLERSGKQRPPRGKRSGRVFPFLLPLFLSCTKVKLWIPLLILPDIYNYCPFGFWQRLLYKCCWLSNTVRSPQITAGFIGTVCTDQRPFTSMLRYTDRIKPISKWEMIKKQKTSVSNWCHNQKKKYLSPPHKCGCVPFLFKLLSILYHLCNFITNYIIFYIIYSIICLDLLFRKCVWCLQFWMYTRAFQTQIYVLGKAVRF